MSKEIRTIAELSKLDPEQIVMGYLSKEPLSKDASDSFIHGWRNGCVDRGLIKPTEAQQALAKEFFEDNEMRILVNRHNRPMMYTRGLSFREHA